MTEMLQQPYTGPSAWTRAQMEADKSWIYTLSPAEIAEIRAAVAVARGTGKPLEAITREDFPLATLPRRLDALGEELENGRGFEMWRGLPVDEWSIEERSVAYWGLGLYLGTAVVQNARGELFGHVRDTTAGADPQTNANTRFYHTNRAAPFHVDGADIVGLMCVRTAKAGGASLVVSSTSIYNALLRDHPDVIPLLYQPLWFDHRGERNAVTGKPYWGHVHLRLDPRQAVDDVPAQLHRVGPALRRCAAPHGRPQAPAGPDRPLRRIARAVPVHGLPAWRHPMAEQSRDAAFAHGVHGLGRGGQEAMADAAVAEPA